MYRRIQRLRVQTVGAVGAAEPDYSTVAPLLFFSNFPPTTSIVARNVRQRASALGSLIFGVTLFVPTHNTQSNASHWGFQAGVSTSGDFNVYRQSWQTRRPPCGEWLGGGCGALRSKQLPYDAACVDFTLHHFFFDSDVLCTCSMQSMRTTADNCNTACVICLPVKCMRHRVVSKCVVGACVTRTDTHPLSNACDMTKVWGHFGRRHDTPHLCVLPRRRGGEQRRGIAVSVQPQAACQRHAWRDCDLPAQWRALCHDGVL